MALDPSFTGSVLNALPLELLISGPMNAMVTAQVQASRAYADFLTGVCLREGKATQLHFDYDEILTGPEGEYAGSRQRSLRIPLMAAITHPNICLEEGSIDFEIAVNSSEVDSSGTSAEVGFEASLGWGPVKAKLSGKVSHHKEQTRSTDTRAKYTISAKLRRQPPPEALNRVIEFLTEAATTPVLLPKNATPGSKDALPADSVLPSPAAVGKKKGGATQK